MKKLFIWALDRGKDQRVAILQKVGLFKGLRSRVLMKLLVDLVEKEYPPGEVIFSEGESGKALYIVLAGSVVISKRQNNSEKVLAENCWLLPMRPVDQSLWWLLQLQDQTT